MLAVGVSHALTIVHMEGRIGATVSDLYFELYDETTPNTVSNFIGYVNRGDYDSMFFHRSAYYGDGTPFVVQGGGFTYKPEYDKDARFFTTGFGGTNLSEFADPVTGELGVRPIGEEYVVDANNDDIPDEDASGNIIYRVNDGLQEVPVDTSVLPVLSEASLSNQRGTIAMALFGSDLDSATNQWFVNMSNNTSLDPTANSGGFTVFGRVLGDGMNFFDEVSNQVVYAMAAVVNSSLGELPVVDYTPYTLIRDQNLIKVNSAKEVLNIDISDHDFGFVSIGQVAQINITLTVSGQWTTDIDIARVGDLETLEAPFSATTNCETSPVQAGGTCTITVTFAPTTADNFNDILDIAFNSPNIPNLSINVSGTSRTYPKVASSEGNALDFKYLYPGASETQTVVITNLGQQALTFTDIVSDNTENFTATDNCTGAALQYNESCEINVTFSIQKEGTVTGLLSVITNAPESPFVISMKGTGSLTIVPDIDVEAVHDFGDLLNGESQSDQISLANRGTSELKLQSIVLSGNNSSDFNWTSNCPVLLQPGESCTLTVDFSPATTGAKAAELTVESDDPDESIFKINLRGTSSSDPDNIADAEENAAPNNGDGDGDTVKDSLQQNVVSMRMASGEYITLTTTSLLGFRDVALIENPSPDTMPGDARLDSGVISFSFGPVASTASYKIGMILPPGQKIATLYQYGPTPDNPDPHWYSFMFDEKTGTGAQIFNNVTLTSPNGRPMQRNIVQIWYVDGQRGDDDLSVNGIIKSTGGISTALASSNASSLTPYAAPLLALLLLLRRRRSMRVERASIS